MSTINQLHALRSFASQYKNNPKYRLETTQSGAKRFVKAGADSYAVRQKHAEGSVKTESKNLFGMVSSKRKASAEERYSHILNPNADSIIHDQHYHTHHADELKQIAQKHGVDADHVAKTAALAAHSIASEHAMERGQEVDLKSRKHAQKALKMVDKAMTSASKHGYLHDGSKPEEAFYHDTGEAHSGWTTGTEEDFRESRILNGVERGK